MDYHSDRYQQKAAHQLLIRERSDKLINFFIPAYFVIGLLLAVKYDTWLLAIGSGSICVVAYYSTKMLLPRSNLYQYVLSAVLGVFMAQFIYQMHGLFEMHFFAFIGSVVLVTYQNPKLQLPMLVVVVIHHIAFNLLQQSGYDGVYFTELDYINLEAFIIHLMLTSVIFVISGLSAYQLRTYSESQSRLDGELTKLQEEAIVLYERKKNEEALKLSNIELRKSKLEVENAYLEAERERNHAIQASQAKDVFLATMSHEIRTPLNGVIGMSLLLSETSLSEQQQLYTDTIVSCGESLMNVINDILDFSKIDSGNMELEKEDFNLRTCIEEVLDIFGTKASEKGIELMYDIDPEVPDQIVGDTMRLRQVISNLVSNAMKFTEKGEVFVRVHLLETLDHGRLRLQIQVKDSGIGIPADKIVRLFKSFSQVDSSTTRKFGGTGLGLAISKKLVHLMDGNISVKSEPGKGSIFTFTLLTMRSTKLLESNNQYNMADQEGKRILVVDDNFTNRLLLKKQLESWKLVPEVAATGNEALEMLSSGNHFDLVFTDMQMPEMDGIELALAIRTRLPMIPIILLSSIGDFRNKDHLLVFSSILTKPIKQHLLGKHMLSGLNKHPEYLVETKPKKEKLTQDFSNEFPLNILVAEDNLINQQVIQRILNNLGYHPDLVENGQEALIAVNKNTYDIVLMDMQMPEMNGLEATAAIRMLHIKQPTIIALTANTMEGDQQDCLKAGMNDFLSKPIKLEELLDMLKKWHLHDFAI